MDLSKLAALIACTLGGASAALGDAPACLELRIVYESGA